MENDSITKTKLQFFPGLMLLIFAIILSALKVVGPPSYEPARMLVSLSAWLFSLFAIVFTLGSIIIFITKKIRRGDEYEIVKKTVLIALEFVILALVFFYVNTNNRAQALIRIVFSPSKVQIEKYLQKINTLSVGKEISQSEVDTIKIMFKEGAPSRIYDEMQKGHFTTPKGAKSRMQNNLLEIEKLDGSCYFVGTKNKAYLKKCADGDIYVKYGWDACFPGQLDCIGENYTENYLIRNVNGKYEIIEAN